MSAAHKPTEASIDLVFKMARCGTPHKQICVVIGVSDKTLTRHYHVQLDTASIIANSAVAGFLFDNAEAGNVAAQIFWLKTRAGWKEMDDALGRMEDMVKAMAVVRSAAMHSEDGFEALGKD